MPLIICHQRLHLKDFVTLLNIFVVKRICLVKSISICIHLVGVAEAQLVVGPVLEEEIVRAAVVAPSLQDRPAATLYKVGDYSRRPL